MHLQGEIVSPRTEAVQVTGKKKSQIQKKIAEVTVRKDFHLINYHTFKYRGLGYSDSLLESVK